MVVTKSGVYDIEGPAVGEDCAACIGAIVGASRLARIAPQPPGNVIVREGAVFNPDYAEVVEYRSAQRSATTAISRNGVAAERTPFAWSHKISRSVDPAATAPESTVTA